MAPGGVDEQVEGEEGADDLVAPEAVVVELLDHVMPPAGGGLEALMATTGADDHWLVPAVGDDKDGWAVGRDGEATLGSAGVDGDRHVHGEGHLVGAAEARTPWGMRWRWVKARGVVEPGAEEGLHGDLAVRALDDAVDVLGRTSTPRTG